MRILDYLNFFRYIQQRRYVRPIEPTNPISHDKKDEKKDN
jgi:hypothetical protein